METRSPADNVLLGLDELCDTSGDLPTSAMIIEWGVALLERIPQLPPPDLSS